jgi:hypothetical protein
VMFPYELKSNWIIAWAVTREYPQCGSLVASERGGPLLL